MTTLAPLPAVVDVLVETHTTPDEWIFGLRAIGAALGITYYARIKSLCDSGKLPARRVQNTNPISSRRYPYQWMAKKADLEAWRRANGKAPPEPEPEPQPAMERLILRLAAALEANTRELMALRELWTSPAL